MLIVFCEKRFMKMLNGSVTSICLPNGEEYSNITPEAILWLAIFVIFIVTAYVDLRLIWHDDKVKCIEKEVESLKALREDYEQLLEQGEEVEARARSFWHSELNLDGIRPQLCEAEKQWVESIKELVREAEECVANYDKHSGRVYHSYTALLRMIPINEVIRQIGKVKSAIDNHFVKKENEAKNIYQSMEKSRSKYRRLLNRNPIQESEKSVPTQQPKSRKPISELMTKSKDLFSGMEERWSIYLLLPLHAFLNDLCQLQLETETEKSWKREAEKLIADAEVCIDNFLRWNSNNINPIATIKFKSHMKRIIAEFDKLLERKHKYGFDFTDRAAEKFIFPSTYQNIDDNATTSAEEDIRSRLSNVEQNSNEVNEINSLFNALKEMKKELYKREETDGRKACLELIERYYEEASQILDNSLKSYTSVLELKHFEQIKKAVERLWQIIKACKIETGKASSVVGLKSDIRNLVSKLTTNSDDHSVLSIVGMTGVGKTALAHEIYYNKTVAKHFSIRAWAQVSRKPYETQVLLMRIDASGELLSVKEVNDHLKEKPCLVVLDEVSSEGEWKKLKPLLSGMGNGSRILLTTRYKSVALLVAGSTNLYQLRLRTKGEGWRLFKMVTSNPTLDQDVEKLARKVVGRCGGLPLAILSLGCLMLANGVTKKPLKEALDEINQGQNQTPWRQAWLANYKDLSRTLKNCLYCFTLFPIDYEIPARRLVTLWVAEGLVEQNERVNDNKETPEDVAVGYLEKLRDCYMIQVVQLKSNGKIKTCRLPSMLREFIMRDGNRTSRGQYYNTYIQRRFAYHVDARSLDSNLANVFSKKGIPLSVLFFDKREGNKPGEHTWNILSTGITSRQFLVIRVLDLECVFRPQLPEAVSKLIYLKYLGLRWTYLEAIPPFIGKLLNLEILDVKHTCIRVIPSSIWRLKNLRHLYLNQSYRSKLEGKLRGYFQDSLQTLWGLFIDGSSPLLHELHRMKNLRKLKLAFQLTQTEQDILAKQIVQLNQLQTLRLRSIDEMGEPQHLRLNNMSELKQLSSLHLFGNLEDRLRGRLPQSLTHLTLSASKLPFDPMPVLQNLPKLKSLCFYAESYTGKRMVCSRGSFQELQVLRFWKIEDLEKWHVEEGAMPNLMELEIRSCKKLEFSNGLKHLKYLHKIKLPDMPEQFKKATEQNYQTFWDDVEIIDD